MLINSNDALAELCGRLKSSRFLALDTEFLRDRTYWPKLCLIQVAGENDIAAIDPLADGLDLSPLYALLHDKNIIKVFHAARQDLEIFYALTGQVPAPLADTQVMAMVCGFGDAVSYENIVAKLAKASIDKSSRFTDWSLRPLSDRQIAYALDDVRYLRPVYEKLEKKLQEKNRISWIAEEMEFLSNPAIYKMDPNEAWTRIKTRLDKPRFFTIIRDLAAWREREAQHINIPRGRVLKDEALMEIAHHLPKDIESLSRVRGLSTDFARGRLGTAILGVIQNAQARAPDPLPEELTKKSMPSSLTPVADMLKMLLRIVAEQEGVAAKLIANSSDIEALAENDHADIPALHGWRREVFGNRALQLKTGKSALKIKDNKIHFIEMP